ncbi:FAD-dependent oxidoreductase [Denitratisoma oestradiolicum]|uniref:2,4-dienoyl-CoA reductase n=1 Tax=Denitratisoma oestradiolicum TaxID=311182 RepID=A0A6S6YIU4_9PROT|nr:FAD-dependent oxidoreductase [Denitratisoma oestradiolicum]TWO80582.1 NADH:flavin oxidoreductase [Denitratisoma oestradiolicum]CAB1367654.1 2,4-dienoyl-CoA reductase [Denitratisoma oestradiolicum]
MSANAYSHLLAPGRIGQMELKNRMIVTAMGVNLAEDGYCTERLRAYHEEQAKGGVGLVNMGVSGVAWPHGGNQPGQIAISDDRFIPGLKAVADSIHAHGAKFTIQIHHGGVVSVEDMAAGRPVWVPSLPGPFPGAGTQMVTDVFTTAELELMMANAKPRPKPEFKEMTLEDIQTIIGKFADAADRAKRAGADGVEIHGGHGYLISGFLSPKSNKRTDDYGGPLENRARLLVEIIRAVRERTGPGFAIMVKLDSQEYGVETGIKIEDAVRAAQMAEQAGADAITVSSYHDTGKLKLHSQSNIPHIPGWNLPAAERIKQAVSIPVIASGRVEPEVGEAKIAAGAFDFLGMGRKLLADPHLPRKLAEGKPETIRPCIYCYTCVSAIYLQDTVRCAVNSECAFEYQRKNGKPAPKRYVVVGGGPGGMEAARRLDEQGHQVTLLEGTDRLGGTLQFASIAYEPNQRLLNWLRRGIESSKVEVRLNTRATPELVASLKPDAVLVATGALRSMPPIPGSEQNHVFSGDDMRRLVLGMSSPELARKVSLPVRMATKLGAVTGMTSNLDFLRRATHWWMPLGKHIVIIGGELVGLELAEFLMERGRTVTVVDDAPRFGAGLLLVRRMRMLEELKEHGVGLFPSAQDIRIDKDAVRFTLKEGGAQAIPADHVIVAKGATGNPVVADQLRAAGFNVHAFGDCTGVSYIEGAIRGAADIVNSL